MRSNVIGCRSSRVRHDLAINLTLRELRGQYKRSVLGWTWSLLNPLATVAIYSLVFGFFLKIDPPTGRPERAALASRCSCCAALLPWNFFSNGMNAALGSLVGNANLIKKVYFPREVLVVVARSASLLVTFLIELGVLCVDPADRRQHGAAVDPGGARARGAPDRVRARRRAVLSRAQRLLPRRAALRRASLLQVLFYSAPIVYPIRSCRARRVSASTIPLLRIYTLNPLVALRRGFRDVLYDLRFPPLCDARCT